MTTTLYSASYTGGSLSVNITKDISALQGKYTLRLTLSKYGNWIHIIILQLFKYIKKTDIYQKSVLYQFFIAFS